ncbi:MAG: hypothetical protein ACFFFT_03745 [Candidatus Thorarchaeota archaeon]
MPVKGQEFADYEDLNDINHLEYSIEFNPQERGYSATKYAIELNKITRGDNDILKVALYYNDLELTSAMKHFSYELSLNTREILDTSNNFYDDYFVGTSTELFLNLSNIGNPQLFRMDENVIFAEYLKDDLSLGIKKINIEFNYAGEVALNENFLHNFTTYHYNATYSWNTQGIT